jgi:hypothetical protein
MGQFHGPGPATTSGTGVLDGTGSENSRIVARQPVSTDDPPLFRSRGDQGVPGDRTKKAGSASKYEIFASGISGDERPVRRPVSRGIRHAQQPAGADIPAARNGQASVGMIERRGRRRFPLAVVIRG